MAPAGASHRHTNATAGCSRRCCAASGASEAWTSTFVSGGRPAKPGVDLPTSEVTNPLVESERFLRSSMMPGLLRAVLYNTERRQGDIRLFEVGASSTACRKARRTPTADLRR